MKSEVPGYTVWNGREGFEFSLSDAVTSADIVWLSLLSVLPGKIVSEILVPVYTFER